MILTYNCSTLYNRSSLILQPSFTGCPLLYNLLLSKIVSYEPLLSESVDGRMAAFKPDNWNRIDSDVKS